MRKLLLLLALPFASATAQDAALSDLDRVLLAVLALPTRTDELRAAGVPNQLIAATIDDMRRDQLTSAAIVDLLTIERDDLWRTK
jgi:hypothetical protein